MKKKIFSVALIMLMIISCLTAIPFTASAEVGGDTYKLVTDASQLKAGGKYLIVCTTENTMMGAQDNTNYRTAIKDITITSENKITDIPAGTQVITLGGSEGAWTLLVGVDQYLYWNTGNYVRTGTDAHEWSITIDANGTASIISSANAKRKLQYNSGNPRFACYESVQKSISLFKLEHKHTYKWNDVIGTDGNHTEVCENTDGECKELTKIVDCTWESGYCSVCNAQAPECDHPTTTEVGEVPAKCEEVGYTAGVQCTVCNQYVSGHEEIKATGHTTVIDQAVDPTCKTTGLTEGSHCSVCNVVLTAQSEKPATPHKYDVSGICTSCKFAILDITVSSFENVDTYNWYTWTAISSTKVNVTGSGFITKNSTEIQMNGDKAGDYIYNTTPLPGNIVSVTLKKASGTDRNFGILTSDTPFDSATTASLKDEVIADAKKKVTEEGVTWEFETNHKYFAIVLTDSNAAYLSSIEIAYEPIGDINGDDKINILDLLILKKVIKGETVANAQNTDLDGDGVTDEKDFEMLRKILLAI